MGMKTINILGVPFSVLTPEAAIDLLVMWLDGEKNHVVVTPNPEGVMQAARNEDFANALKSADLTLADGTGIFIASVIYGSRLPARVRGVDTTFGLLERLAEMGRPVTAFFLGGRPQRDGKPSVAESAAKNMEAKYGNLKVVGHHDGYYTESEEKCIVENINGLRPDILLVCLGMPKAEIFASRYQNINAKITLCVGSTIDIMAGEARLAPAFLRKVGLEWLYRLIKEPRRFFRMLDLPRFVAAVLWNRLAGRAV